MQKWYVIYTKSRKEKVALQNLNAQGYDAHLPLIKLEKIIRHKKAVIEEPLFPRYLFIRLDDAGLTRLVTHSLDNWRLANG